MSPRPPPLPAEGSLSSETLLSALLRLENSLNGTSICSSRIKSLWKAIALWRTQLDELQNSVFNAMNKMAKFQSESPIVKSCPWDGFEPGRGCYYSPEEKLRKWTDARLACGKLGADLAHPYPQNMQAFKNWVGSISSGWGFYYIGGKLNPEDEYPLFRWVDGRRISSDNPSFTEPFRVIDSDNCIAMENHLRFRYKPKSCDSFRRWYICEIKIQS